MSNKQQRHVSITFDIAVNPEEKKQLKSVEEVKKFFTDYMTELFSACTKYVGNLTVDVTGVENEK